VHRLLMCIIPRALCALRVSTRDLISSAYKLRRRRLREEGIIKREGPHDDEEGANFNLVSI
jgi:hypothetical protein